MKTKSVKEIRFIFCLLVCTSVIFAVGELRPFPQAQTFAGCLKPNNVTQAQMNSAVQNAYDSYKAAYIKNQSGYYWAQQNTVTTSEAHSYAMAIVVLMAGYDANAKTIFDGLCKFYQAHYSVGGNDFGMNWNPQSVTSRQMDTNDGDAATDGDMGIAYALVLADRQWGSTGTYNYLQMAKNIMTGMLNSEEMAAANNGVLQIADDAYSPTLTRTSDWIIDHFKTYQAITPADSAKYQKFIDKIHTFLGTASVCNATTGLLPGFVLGTTPNKGPETANEANYAYNSCRDPWRLAMAYMHNGDATAKAVATKQATWAYGQSSTFQLKDGGYTLAGSPLQANWGTATAIFIAPYAVASQLTGNQTMVNNAWSAAVSASAATEGVYDDGVRLLCLLAASGNWWNPVASSPVTTYSITGTVTGSGTISPTLPLTVNSGASQTLTFSPSSGYKIDSVKVNNVKVTLSGATYTISNITSNQSVGAWFSPIPVTYTITGAVTGNGTISPALPLSVNSGTNQTLTFTPTSGSQLDSVKVNSSKVSLTGSTYTIANITTNQSVEAWFSVIPVTYVVTGVINGSGTIQPTLPDTVVEGSTLLLTFTPEPGNKIDSVKVANKKVALVGDTYTIPAIYANKAVKVWYSPDTFTISASVSAGARLTPTGAVSVVGKSNQSFTYSADNGYYIDSVVVDGSVVATSGSYTFNTVIADHSIDVYASLLPVGKVQKISVLTVVDTLDTLIGLPDSTMLGNGDTLVVTIDTLNIVDTTFTTTDSLDNGILFYTHVDTVATPSLGIIEYRDTLAFVVAVFTEKAKLGKMVGVSNTLYRQGDATVPTVMYDLPTIYRGGEVTVSLYDPLGNKLFSHTQDIRGGMQKIALPFDSVVRVSGSYLLVVVGKSATGVPFMQREIIGVQK